MPPVLVLAPAWLLGIFLQGWLEFSSLWLWIGLGGSLVLGLVAFVYNRQPRLSNLQTLPTLAPLALTAICVGALRLSWAAPSSGPDNLIYYLGQPPMTIKGLVSAEPTYTEGARSGTFRLSATQIILPQGMVPLPVSGEIYVRTNPDFQPTRGDLLQITGSLVEPQEITGDNFPYRDWLNHQGIFTTMNFPRTQLLATEQDFWLVRLCYRLNTAATENIQRNVPGQEGALVAAIMLDQKRALQQDRTYDDFKNSGTAHILTVSGSNIAILIMLVGLVLSRFFRKRTVLVLTLAVLVFYVLVVGPSPPVLRAGLMGALSIGGYLLGREYIGLLGLAVSAFIMTLWQPTALMDISFQLTFVATLGLIVFARPWQARTKNWPLLIQEGLIVTVAAELMVLPLVAFYFHQISLVSILANLMVIPAMILIMATGGLVGLVGWLPFVGSVAGVLAWPFPAYTLVVARFWANLPFSVVSVSVDVWEVLGYYFLLGLVVWWRQEVRKAKAAHTASLPKAESRTVLRK